MRELNLLDHPSIIGLGLEIRRLVSDLNPHVLPPAFHLFENKVDSVGVSRSIQVSSFEGDDPAIAISVPFRDGGNPSPSGEVPIAIGSKTLSLLPP